MKWPVTKMGLAVGVIGALLFVTGFGSRPRGVSDNSACVMAAIGAGVAGAGVLLSGGDPTSAGGSDHSVFDLQSVNRKLDGIKRGRIVGGLAVIALLTVVELVILSLFARSYFHRDSNAGLLLATLVGTTASALAIVAITVRGLRRMRPGVRSLLVDQFGVELSFERPPPVRLDWEDPRLDVMLDDLTSARPEDLATDTPYFLVTRGLFCALSPEAFRAILVSARSGRLSEQIECGSRGLVATSSFPRVRYHFRNRAAGSTD